MEDAEWECTVEAPVNIALVKYWGKRDSELILPYNDSVSLTLDEKKLGTRTTIRYSASYEEDSLVLNGQPTVISSRLSNVIEEIRRAFRKHAVRTKMKAQDLMSMSRYRFRIETNNKMPTAAGLASSASGMACITFALCTALGITDSVDMSQLARLGSGSACRSIYGGLVQWEAGKEEDGSDSLAKQIYPASTWPELKLIVLVVDGEKKKVGSTEGMQRSMDTSEYMLVRPKQCKDRIQEVCWAFQAKLFPALAEVIIKDSNTLHAICRDSYPPVNYLSRTSEALIDFVHRLNEALGEVSVAYTFDAGPNCFLIFEEKHESLLMWLLLHTFIENDVIDPTIHWQPKWDDDELVKYRSIIDDFSNYRNSVKNYYESTVGSGPKVVNAPRLI